MAKRVCIAVSDEHLRVLVEFALTSKGYEAATVGGGGKALGELLKAGKRDSPLDLLVTDLVETESKEQELIDEISRRKVEIPILAIIEEEATEASRAVLRSKGCSGFVRKPLNPYDLVEQAEVLTNCDAQGKLMASQGNFDLARLEVFYNQPSPKKLRK